MFIKLKHNCYVSVWSACQKDRGEKKKLWASASIYSLYTHIIYKIMNSVNPQVQIVHDLI